jgi:uncharacterized membrane protein
MSILVLALLIGVVTGLRSLTGPAAVSWAAALGWLPLGDTWLAFLGYAATPYILTAAALAELIADKLPRTGSRKAPGPFAFRIILGALCGAALGEPGSMLIGGAAAGAVGAVIGTLGGYEARTRLAASVGRDMPIALLEDVIAVGAAIWIVASV